MNEYSINQVQSYATKSVFVSSGAFDSDQLASGGLRQIARVQSVEWGVDYPVEQVTYLDAGDEAYLSSHNPLNVTIAYLHVNGRAEQALGLVDLLPPSGAL